MSFLFGICKQGIVFKNLKIGQKKGAKLEKVAPLIKSY